MLFAAVLITFITSWDTITVCKNNKKLDIIDDKKFLFEKDDILNLIIINDL